MIVHVKFDSNWVFSDGGVHASDMHQFIRKCRDAYVGDIEVKADLISECTLVITRQISPDALKQQLIDMVNQVLKKNNCEDICQITVKADESSTAAPEKNPAVSEKDASAEDASVAHTIRLLDTLLKKGTLEVSSAEDAPKAPVSSDPPQDEASAPDETPAAAADTSAPTAEEAPSVLELIDARIGSADFKKLCHEIHLRAPIIRKMHTEDVFRAEIYLACADTGSGYSSAMEQFRALLVEEALLDADSDVSEFTLPDPTSNNLSENMDKLYRTLEHAMSKSRVISLDVSAWKDQTDDKIFKSFLMYIFRHNRCGIIFLRFPTLSQSGLEWIYQSVNDIVSPRLVTFPPFTNQELRALLSDYLRKSGYSMGEDAWSVYDALIVEEKNDGYFYGVQTVRKVSGKIIQAMELHCAQSNELSSVISRDAIASLLHSNEESSMSGLDSLDELIGMTDVSAQIREMVNQIIYAKAHMQSVPCMHMCFVGNPGTGKTTVARLLGEALKNAGILRVGKFYEHHGREFCGKYVGHTAPLTKSICEKAYGSILFVDEAYSLVASGSDNDYGQEAIDTLIAEMENHKDDFIVVFAGYPDDMDKLLNANPGMRSRVPYTITFPNYTAADLSSIFMHMIDARFSCEDGFSQRVEEYFSSIPDSVLQDKSFGNARFVRNIYERVWSKAISHDPAADPRNILLTIADFNAAVSEFPIVSHEKKIGKIGFGL